MKDLKRLEQLFSLGTISRREFLSRSAALGLTAAVSPMLLGKSSYAAKPKKGGILRIGLSAGAASDTFDPAVQKNPFTAHIMYIVHDKLLDINTDGSLRPELAESWKSSYDLKTWTFKIRKGVDFHNGKTVNAADVVASLNHHRQEGTKSVVKSLLGTIDGIKAIDNHEVVITLNVPYAEFPFVLTTRQLVICPAKDNDIDWKSGIGAGPYIVENFEPGVEASFKINPNYWDSDRGHFNQVNLLAIHDTTSRTNALKSGKIDIMDSPDLKTVHLLAKAPGIRVEEVTSPGHISIPMLTDTPPFDNNDLRLALKYSIDRKALLNIILKGHGSLGNDHPISQAYRFFAKDLPQRTYDPDKAKFYLKKAGYDTIKVSLHTAETAALSGVDAAVLYKEHAAKAGITIDVVKEPNDGYWGNVWLKKPWCFATWLGRPTEDLMFTTAYASEAKWNDTHWKNERFNKLLKEARTVREEAKRREMYFEMQQIVRDEGGTVIPLFINWVMAYNKKLKHAAGLHGDGPLDGYRMTDRWYFDI